MVYDWKVRIVQLWYCFYSHFGNFSRFFHVIMSVIFCNSEGNFACDWAFVLICVELVLFEFWVSIILLFLLPGFYKIRIYFYIKWKYS